ncbi:anthranilate synthase component I family protein [Hyphococcus lacteus]|uniref:Anthranilate synthase component I family protein n=1 Tax=Hyphococcus lacteus TaxID=3143536 RepID=A0ABV3Z3T4_9PROT
MVSIEIEWQNPIDAFAPFAGVPHAHLLHAGDGANDAEWSILVAAPVEVIEGATNKSLQRLDEILQQRRGAPVTEEMDFPFCGGVLGYIGYEAASLFEPSLKIPASPYLLPDISFGIYDAAALFSVKLKRMFVVGRTEVACKALCDVLATKRAVTQSPLPSFQLGSNFSATEYKNAVNSAIENILDGDFYQVNFSHRITAQAESELDVYSIARSVLSENNSRFGAFLQFAQGQVVSASPERFFQIECDQHGNRRILTEPIKGTRPRGKDNDEDILLAGDLLSDPKDRAENIMIADLLRNDLSRVCDDFSIREDAICELMTLKNVFHLVSKISGALRQDVTFSEILRALFPCGSITGAPKVEAMRTIARTEKIGRGPYCGAIGYFSDHGRADFSVAIRIMLVSERSLSIPVGGGITLRSDPEKEYRETLDKAKGVLSSIGMAAADIR